jgi:hypothetical protein
MIRRIGPPLDAPKFIIEEVTDPIELERNRCQHEQAVRNMDWLCGHWDELLPAAWGKYVAVAAQQAFVADTFDDAYEKALACHPDEKGILVQFVSPVKGARVYASRRDVGPMS